MEKATKTLLMAICFGVLTVALGALSRSESEDHRGPLPVTVTNDPSKPVPTINLGTTAVSGTVTALQGGSWNVNVGNQLNPSNVPVPLLVQADGEPFTLGTNCNPPTTPCAPANPGQPNITLPTGSGAFAGTVVIEFVSALCGGLAAATIPEFPLQVFGPGLSNPAGQQNVGLFRFPGVPQTGSPLNPWIAGSNISWFAQQTRIYAQPGSVAMLLMGQNNGCTFSLSGHLTP